MRYFKRFIEEKYEGKKMTPRIIAQTTTSKVNKKDQEEEKLEEESFTSSHNKVSSSGYATSVWQCELLKDKINRL